jgi:hypothetical protein
VTTIDKNALTKNQQLIAALIAGKPFSISNSSYAGLQTPSSPLNLAASGYTVTLVNGLLKFNSETGLHNFWAATDITVQQWDPINDAELQGLPSEKYLAGEPALNDFDNTMGFTSLRRKYDMLYYENPNFEDTIKIKVNNPDDRIVLNDKAEIQIGDTIMKYLSTYVVAKISNSNYKALTILRNANGAIVDHPNITYWDPSSNTQISIAQSVSPTTTCTVNMNFVKLSDDQQDFKRKTLSYTFQSFINTNLQVFVVISGAINWGDGFSTTFNNIPTWAPQSFVHTYNTNPAPGACTQYTITVTGQVVSSPVIECFNLTVGLPSGPLQTSVCAPNANCKEDNRSAVTDPPTYFTYGGIDYKVTGRVTVDNNRGIFGERTIIFGKTYWYKKYGTEWYPTRNRKARLGVELYNSYQTNGCTTPNNFYDQYWKFNRSDIQVKYNTNKNKIGWIPDVNTGIKTNHYVRIVKSDGSVVEFSYLNHYLH